MMETQTFTARSGEEYLTKIAWCECTLRKLNKYMVHHLFQERSGWQQKSDTEYHKLRIGLTYSQYVLILLSVMKNNVHSHLSAGMGKVVYSE